MKRKISVYFEEVYPSKINAYKTSRFRIGEEYEFDLPEESNLSSLPELLLTELHFMGDRVKKSVRDQIEILKQEEKLQKENGIPSNDMSDIAINALKDLENKNENSDRS